MRLLGHNELTLHPRQWYCWSLICSWSIACWHCCNYIFTNSTVITQIFFVTCDKAMKLTHWGLVTPYGDIDLVNIGSGNGLLPDGTKPLPESMLTYHKYGLVAITQGLFHIKYLSHQFLKWAWNARIKISFKSPGGQWVKTGDNYSNREVFLWFNANKFSANRTKTPYTVCKNTTNTHSLPQQH